MNQWDNLQAQVNDPYFPPDNDLPRGFEAVITASQFQTNSLGYVELIWSLKILSIADDSLHHRAQIGDSYEHTLSVGPHTKYVISEDGARVDRNKAEDGWPFISFYTPSPYGDGSWGFAKLLGMILGHGRTLRYGYGEIDERSPDGDLVDPPTVIENRELLARSLRRDGPPNFAGIWIDHVFRFRRMFFSFTQSVTGKEIIYTKHHPVSYLGDLETITEKRTT